MQASLRDCGKRTYASCLSISPIVQAKKPQHSLLCLRFLACTLEEIPCAICTSSFPAVPKRWISPPLNPPLNCLLRGMARPKQLALAAEAYFYSLVR